MSKSLHPDSLFPRTYLDSERSNRPLSLPILQGTVFTAANAAEHARLYQKEEPTFYQRFGHPTAAAVAAKVAGLEGAEAGLLFSSGMAAVSTTLFTLARSGGHVIASAQLFEQTERFLNRLAEKFDCHVTYVDTRDPLNAETALRAGTAYIYIETPSNPQLRIADIAAFAAIARKAKIPLIVDGTFAPPPCQYAVKLGAALVIHSATKFLNGHMDVMGGVVAGKRELVHAIAETQELLGGVADPHAAWLLARGLKTLGVRMERIAANALAIAGWLDASGLAADVRYPLLKSFEGFATASKQMTAGGGIVSFRIKKGRKAARRFLDSLKLIHIASSLGGVETTIELPYDLDWFEKEGEGSAEGAFDPALVRLSVGIEHPDDLIADLKQALEKVA